VKKQQGSETEVLLIGSGVEFVLLNFVQYREKLRKWKFCTSEFCTIS
jgi:hypothetical protein